MEALYPKNEFKSKSLNIFFAEKEFPVFVNQTGRLYSVIVVIYRY
jgi:hypothetical protein